MNARPAWVSWLWDVAVLAVGTLLTMRGDDAAKQIGHYILGGAVIGIYASRMPARHAGTKDDRKGPPFDPGLMSTIVAGVGGALHRVTGGGWH